MKITQDCAVSFEFTMTDEKGNILDSSQGKTPYEYLHGHRQVVPGLEFVLEGKTSGDTFVISIPPEQAYGLYDEARKTTLARNEFEDDELIVGNRVYIMGGSGPRLATILQFDDKKVVLDVNHELAGKTLCFDVKILGVRKATFSELGCGHVHDPINTDSST